MTKPNPNHPSYAILYVDSPEASARFYAELLSAKPAEASPTFALFALDSGLKLGLWSRHTVQPPPSAEPGAAELGIRLANDAAVDATHADWRGKGVTILREPFGQDFGRSFVALDPDGHRLRIYALAGET
ncbi:VOC family protein [Phreatobacter sp. AB_2022a]|uniref:VOC family protein n=1 Tax=Phreatobacter sp. AB_2022a TaxID=3003134 RepID=UPI00228716AE|nr:VOC family protein [Phreatobacter sp. AB_2022a]MCZ0734255.1 VOC family protein [Phreatobacter sp. AB_2022a]